MSMSLSQSDLHSQVSLNARRRLEWQINEFKFIIRHQHSSNAHAVRDNSKKISTVLNSSTR